MSDQFERFGIGFGKRGQVESELVLSFGAREIEAEEMERINDAVCDDSDRDLSLLQTVIWVVGGRHGWLVSSVSSLMMVHAAHFLIRSDQICSSSS